MYFKVKLKNGLDIYHESNISFSDCLELATSPHPCTGSEWIGLRCYLFDVIVGYRISDIDYVREIQEEEMINLKKANGKV